MHLFVFVESRFHRLRYFVLFLQCTLLIHFIVRLSKRELCCFPVQDIFSKLTFIPLSKAEIGANAFKFVIKERSFPQITFCVFGCSQPACQTIRVYFTNVFPFVVELV